MSSRRYKLKKDHESPGRIICKEVVKDIPEWVKIFPEMWGEDFENYKDWFEEVLTPEPKEKMERDYTAPFGVFILQTADMLKESLGVLKNLYELKKLRAERKSKQPLNDDAGEQTKNNEWWYKRGRKDGQGFWTDELVKEFVTIYSTLPSKVEGLQYLDAQIMVFKINKPQSLAASHATEFKRESKPIQDKDLACPAQFIVCKNCVIPTTCSVHGRCLNEKSAEQKPSQGKQDSPVLFTTEDGVGYNLEEIQLWYIPKGKWEVVGIYGPNYWCQEHCEKGERVPFPENKWFASQSAAKDYVLMNKPCLSVRETFEHLGESPAWLEEKLIDLAKQKINQ